MSNGDQPFSGSPLQEHDPSIEPGDILLPPLDFFNNINLVDDEEESAFVVPENFFSNINLIDEEDVVSSDFFSSINLVDEEPEEKLPQKTKLTNYVPLSTIDQYDRFVEGDHKNMQSDPGVIERFARNFLEGLSPLPAGTLGVDFTEDIMPSEDLSDQVAGAVGQIAGFGVGLFVTGGILGGLKIVGTGVKTTKALADASKMYTRIEKLRKNAKVIKKAKGKSGKFKELMTRANNLEIETDQILSKAGVIKENTLLGKSQNYRKFVTKLGSGEYEVGKFMSRIKGIKPHKFKFDPEKGIKVANAIDTGINNMVASGIFMQKTIPLGENDEFFVKERLTKPFLDGLFFTAAGLPRAFGLAKLSTLQGSTKKALALESSLAFGAGFGASLSGAGIEPTENAGITDHLMTGALFTAGHYIGVGADKIRIKQAIKEGVEISIGDKNVQKKVIKSANESIDVMKTYLSTKRPEYVRNRFVNKSNPNEVVQLLGVKEAKNKKHVLSYLVLNDRDGVANNTFTMQGVNRQGVLNSFFKKYKNVLPDKTELSVDYFKKNPLNFKSGLKLRTINKIAYQDHQKLANKILKAEESLGMSKKDASMLKRRAFTKSFGTTDRMNMEEMITYDKMLRSKRNYTSIEKAQLNTAIPLTKPLDVLAGKSPTVGAIRNFVKRAVFSPEANLNELGVEGATLSRKLVDHSDTKEIVRGRFTVFIDDLISDFGFSKSTDFDALTYGLNDSKINKLIPEGNVAKLGDKKKLAKLSKKQRDFMDNTFLLGVRNNVEARVDARSGKKGKDIFKPLLTVFDTAGNKVKVADESFDNGDMLKVLRKRKSFVTNTDGKKVKVDINKTLSESLYEENYVPRFLTDEGKTFFKKNRDQFLAVLEAQNPGVPKKDLAVLINNYIEFAESNKPLGILNTRKFDIPPYALVEKGTNAMIQLDEVPNISKVKIGSSITDIDGRERVIGEVIEFYEKDFSTIMQKYSNQVSNSVALFRNFDADGVSGKIASPLLVKLRDNYDRDTYNWAKEVVKLSLGGEDITPWTQSGKFVSKALANVYLSGPSAVIKNFMTGQTQNITSYGFGKVFKSYYNILTGDYSKYKRLTNEIGALSGNIDELSMEFKTPAGKAFGLLSQPFKVIEKFNRRASVAVTDSAIRDSFDLLLNKKSAFFKSKRSARDALRNSMKIQNEDIDYMMSKLRSKNFDNLVLTDGKFRDLYKRALYKSQASTQGVTKLPYIPLWMAKGASKPLTLFYRTAYRVTENTYNRAILPLVVDGNPFPMMKFAAMSGLTGKTVYDYYYNMALGKDLIGKDFKDKEMEFIDYAVKGEMLGVFSNLYDNYGNNVIDGYIPVPIEFGFEFLNFIKNEIGAMGDVEAMKRIGVDYTRKNVSLLNQVMSIYEERNEDINKKFDDQRRLQYQFVDKYPYLDGKRKSSFAALVSKGEINENAFWVKILKESLLSNGRMGGDIQQLKNDFIKTRAFLVHEEFKRRGAKGDEFAVSDVIKEINSRIRSSIKVSMRPYPEDWDDQAGGQLFYKAFTDQLSEKHKKDTKELMEIFYKRMDLLDEMLTMEELNKFNP